LAYVFARHNVELKRIQMTNNNSDNDDGVAAIRQAIQSSCNNNDVIVWLDDGNSIQSKMSGD
jgi:hypothetical protein